MAKLDPNLIDYTVSDFERDCIRAVLDLGSTRKAARELGRHNSNITRAIQKVQRRAAIQGYSPAHDYVHPVPETHVAKGVSTFYDKDGKPRNQWVKSDLREAAYKEAIREAVQAFVKDIEPIVPADGPLQFDGDVVPWIQIGDAHIGMLAHAAETRENFDLKIAERELAGAIGLLIDDLPNVERLVINDLGDATHYDNLAAVTAASGHPLDADGRFPKMLRVYVRVMRAIVDKALTKAKHVDVIVNQGNHSRINDFWITELLRAAYGPSGRVTVLDNENVFIGYRMGKTLVMVHHSDKCPPARLVGVMTSDFRKDFGETEFHYIDTGHVHHHFVSREHPGVVIESWNNLSPNDKWHYEAGYRSKKAVTVVLRSKTYGDVGRRVLSIEEIRDRLSYAGGDRRPAKAVHTI